MTIPAGLSINGPTPPYSSERRLRGPWLLLARFVSAVVVVFALTLFVAGEIATVTDLRVVCRGTCGAEQISIAQLQTLHRLGISLDAYANFVFAVTLLVSLLWFGAAAVVFWRRSDALFLLLLATQLVTQGAEYGAGGLFGAIWQLPVDVLTTLNSIMFCLFLALFPTGRFAPRWMVWVIVPTTVALAVTVLPLPSTTAFLINNVMFPAMLVVLIVAQIYRYRAASNSVQRQQTKWVIFGIGMSLVFEIGIQIPAVLIPGLSAPGTLYPLVTVLIINLALTLGPIAFVIAILRYRLYDIDIIINRTLVYGSLTAILAAVYFGCVVGAQALAQALTGVESLPPIAIVASTLLIAALFTPLRRSIQAFIDRRFYRRKYNAAKTVATFSVALRSEVDLTQLSDHLVAVVRETMQPAHVSLWLRDPASFTVALPARHEGDAR